MYAILDLTTNQLVAQKGQTALTFQSLGRVKFPGVERGTADSPQVGYVFPPQEVDEGEPEAPSPAYKILEVTEVESGSGVVSTVSDPVYDGDAGTVTVTTTLRDKTDKEISDEKDQRATDIMTQDGLIAVLKCINDGSIVPAADVSLGALKTAIRAQL